ncbi:hypothetical protein F2Q68_00025986 [Brassica cretica]|uniref:Uncharacterized protein n=2 Tax=Brassica cretica TaxID=69181 RepID=A0ABQ7DJ04_BRACR|nr:hypothetical protein F2Q68_00025986 [Brassica cretica]KAF3577461.1 hypothetical protein DY000_02032066 [Brassica cretica]
MEGGKNDNDGQEVADEVSTDEPEVQISASKYSVLSVDEEVEEGEVLREDQEENVDDGSEASDQMRKSEEESEG